MARVRSALSQENPFLGYKTITRNMHLQDGQGRLEDLAEDSDASDETDDPSERHCRILSVVKEDMTRLEKIFDEKGMRYRLIDRIGEGV